MAMIVLLADVPQKKSLNVNQMRFRKDTLAFPGIEAEEFDVLRDESLRHIGKDALFLSVQDFRGDATFETPQIPRLRAEFEKLQALQPPGSMLQPVLDGLIRKCTAAEKAGCWLVFIGD